MQLRYILSHNIFNTLVTFTDHETMQAYEIMNCKRDGLVTGVEIKILDPEIVGHTIHVNVYDLDFDQFDELEEIAKAGDLNGFLACLKRNDLPHVYNHPLWFEPGERPNLAAIWPENSTAAFWLPQTLIPGWLAKSIQSQRERPPGSSSGTSGRATHT